MRVEQRNLLGVFQLRHASSHTVVVVLDLRSLALFGGIHVTEYLVSPWIAIEV